HRLHPPLHSFPTRRSSDLVGVRGFVAAYDVNTGKEAWKTFTVPAPGEPGSETWPKGDQWKTGGGSIWVTANYDPETNLAFWGTGDRKSTRLNSSHQLISYA